MYIEREMTRNRQQQEQKIHFTYIFFKQNIYGYIYILLKKCNHRPRKSRTRLDEEMKRGIRERREESAVYRIRHPAGKKDRILAMANVRQRNCVSPAPLTRCIIVTALPNVIDRREEERKLNGHTHHRSCVPGTSNNRLTHQSLVCVRVNIAQYNQPKLIRI